MLVAVSVSQLVLAAVFAIAGVAKLRDQPGTRRSLSEFGVSPRLAPALPVAELGVAAALIPPGSARWAAAGAFGLLVVFSAMMARALARGATPDCNCFGGLSRSAIGRGTLARNAALAALAAFAALGTGEPTGALAWIDSVASSEGVARAVISILLIAVAGLAWFAWRLLRQNGRLLLRIDAQAEEFTASEPVSAAEVGAEAPRFASEDVDGRPVSLESLLSRERPVVLLFSHSDCGACEPALVAAGRAQRERGDEVTLAVVNRGDPAGLRRVRELGLTTLIDDSDASLFSTFGVGAVPAAVQIDGRGRIAVAQVEGEVAVRALIAGAGLREPLPSVLEVSGR